MYTTTRLRNQVANVPGTPTWGLYRLGLRAPRRRPTPPTKLLPSSYQARRRIRGAHQYLLNHSLSEKLGLKSAPSADSVGEKTCGLSEPGKLKRNSNCSGLGIGLGIGLGLGLGLEMGLRLVLVLGLGLGLRLANPNPGLQREGDVLQEALTGARDERARPDVAHLWLG